MTVGLVHCGESLCHSGLPIGLTAVEAREGGDCSFGVGTDFDMAQFQVLTHPTERWDVAGCVW